MKALRLLLVAGMICTMLSACGGSDIPPPEGVDGKPVIDSSGSSVFTGTVPTTPPPTTANPQLPPGDTVDLNGGSSETQQPSTPGQGMFDDIPDPVNTEAPEDLPLASTPREQMIALTDEWSVTIPTVNIELFKLEEGVLKEQISEQFPLSLRYVWGQPKTRMEAADGGYNDIWEIGSEDGSFKGRIIILYDGKDEIRATILSAVTEVLVDDKDLTGRITPAEVQGKSALESLWDRMNNPEVTSDAINADLAALTYEEAIIQWGRSDHKAEDGAYCWRVGDSFICIMFTEEGAFSSYRIENNSSQ